MAEAHGRRIVILAEGQFGPHHGKTAMGVIRYGPRPVVAVIDSTKAGRNVQEWLGDAPRFDIPIVATLDEALALGRHASRRPRCSSGSPRPAASCPSRGATTILAAIGAGLDILSGLHTFIGDDPEFAAAAAARRHRDRRLPPAARAARRPRSAASTARAST